MSSSFDPSSHSHRRYNPLTETWVLCSPHRTKRPWQGAVEPPQLDSRPAYDAKCYLCPGNERAGGVRTEPYEGTFIFENDFAALVESQVDSPLPESSDLSIASLFKQESARGKCYVICFAPRHDLTVAEMGDEEIENVIKAWTKLYIETSTSYPWLEYIQIFENKGSMMGCSNPHPHGQAWSLSYIPTIPQKILTSQRNFANNPMNASTTSVAPRLSNGKPSLLLTYIHQELSNYNKSPGESRVVGLSEYFITVVPFWASWPYEVMIVPFKRHISSLASLTPPERADLSRLIGQTTRRYDNLFECSFAYSMGVYQSPVYKSNAQDDEWSSTTQLHLGFYPPLLRSSTVRKFLVGFELFAETQRDITPEQAARKLRELDGSKHYKTVSP